MPSAVERKSASMRLLLGGYFGGLLILCIGILGFLVYQAVGNHLVEAADGHLLARVRLPLLRMNRESSNPGRVRRPGWGRGRGRRARRRVKVKNVHDFYHNAEGLAEQMAGPGAVVNIYDAEGRRLAGGGFKSRRFQLDERAFQKAIEGEEEALSFQIQLGGSLWHCVLVPVRDKERLVGVVQAATLWDPSAQVLEGLRETLIMAGLISIPLLLLLSNWLAGRLAAPLEEVSGAADRLSEGDLKTRVAEVQLPAELAQLSRSFNHMVDRLEESARAQKRFVADASHELKTPLTSIRGMAELLQRGVGDSPEKFHKLTSTIENEVDRMEALVSDLLLLSRPADEEGQSDLVEVAQRMVETARLTAAGLELTFEGLGPAPVALHSQRLERLVRNLVDNAVKYTPKGGSVAVQVTVENGQATLRVIDTGVGLEPEELQRVFDRFYRADHSRSRQTGGTGLGLAIVRSLTEDAGGTVELLSRPGEGTEAVVRLPLLTIVGG